MGKPLDPDYWRKWRAAHPAYRSREKARTKRRRDAGLLGKGNVVAQRRRRHARLVLANGDNGWTRMTDETLEQARRIASSVVSQDRRTYYHDTLHDDTVSEVVLAMVDGRDPREAALIFVKRERAARFVAPYDVEER